jgi:hypothetical protein
VVRVGDTRYMAVDSRWEVDGYKLFHLLGLVRWSVLAREVEFQTHCVLQVMMENRVLIATTEWH